MGVELVTIVVGGMRWSAFTEITVRAAFNEAARSFSFTAAAEMGASATNAVFEKGTPVSIYANSDLLLSGYVNRRQPSFAEKSAQIVVSGRSCSADLVDGAAEHDTGRFEKRTIKQIADEVSKKYGQTGFRSRQKLKSIEQYQLTPGETCFRCVEKLARAEGLTLAGTADGYIEITKAGSDRHSGGLIEGQNIKSGSADHNDSNQHSTITVRGQRPFGHGVDNLEIEAIAREYGVKRHRPVIVIQDEDTTKDRAKSRAKNRRDRAAGNALKAQITVQGFRDDGGTVWTPGHLVWVESAFLDIAQDMLIESVDFNQDEGGSICSLSLTDPRAYGAEGEGKGNKSGKSWKGGASADPSDDEGS